MLNNKPNIAICVGAAKSGTSWLFKCLEEHPDVAAARGKETDFFLGNDINCDGFFSYFEPTQTTSWYFESSPKYLHTVETANKVHDCFTEAKIIILLRKPIDRTESHLRHMLSTNKYPVGTPVDEAEKITPEIVSGSMYHLHVPRFERVFGERNVLVLQYERIATEPQAVINEVCNFLKIDRFSPKFLNIKYNTGKARMNPLYLKIRSLYVKSRRYTLTRSLTRFLRRIGLHSGVLEKILTLHTRSTNIEIPDQFKSNKLKKAEEYYFKRFSN